MAVIEKILNDYFKLLNQSTNNKFISIDRVSYNINIYILFIFIQY